MSVRRKKVGQKTVDHLKHDKIYSQIKGYEPVE